MRTYYMIFYRDNDDFATIKPYDGWKYDSQEEALTIIADCIAQRSPYDNMTILKFYTRDKK